MNALEKHLKETDPSLFSKFEETKKEVNLLLDKYSSNFPEYTDHSANHTLEVFKIAAEVLTDEETQNLNCDEIYILSMACLLHDVGMCIPGAKIKSIPETHEFLSYQESHPHLTAEQFLRDIHHELSNKFILEEWELLKIPSKKYATGIGLIAQGHRKVDLGNFENYDPQFFAKSGKESVCLPFLACILRIADELDVTNSRTPKLLTKYYMPNNEVSIREWSKHMATSQRNYRDNTVIFEVDCSDQNIYAALQEQFEKIQNVINYTQKIIRAIPPIKGKHYSLNLSLVNVKYNFIGFNPKGIRFSFDVQNVVTAFIGEELYKDKFTSLREAIQNSIDSCRYKIKVLKEIYTPQIKIFVENKSIRIEDNGAGMDEFIIENFFGRLASSFYEQEKIKSQFEAIGQFGVGVFSYFLMSEYVDIETKTINTDALKFRFDKDPKSYFHFYEKAERNIPGTTITLYLKDELIGKLVDSKIENYIRKVFKHIEIPLELNINGSITLIEFQPFEIDQIKEIKERLKLQHRKISDELEIKQIIINDVDVEGSCALIVAKDYLNIFSIHRNYFDPEIFRSRNRGHNFSQISISQKGVFVNNYSSNILNFLIGDINLKNKVKINIDRNEFTNETDIYKLINRFEIRILKEIFYLSKLKCKNNDGLYKITNAFLDNYFTVDIDSENIFINEFVELFKVSLYVKLYFNGGSSIINLQSLMDSYKDFVLISNKENADWISEQFKKPVLIAEGYFYYGSYEALNHILTDLLGYNNSIMYIDNKGYQILELTDRDQEYYDNLIKLKEVKGNSYEDCVKSNSKKIFINNWENKEEIQGEYDPDEFLLNYNHFFIQYCISNYKEISLSSIHKKIIKAAFSYMNEIKSDEIVTKDSVKKLNDILKPLNQISKLKKITLADL